MRYLKLLPFCMFVVGLSAQSQDAYFGEQKTKMRLSVSSLSVNSSTANNALRIENSLMLNNALTGTVDYYSPSISNFKGKTIDWETSIRYSSFFRSNFLFSYSSAKAGAGSVGNFYDSTWTYSGTDYRDTVATYTAFGNNTLTTFRIGYSMDFFAFRRSESTFLNNLAIRAGIESFKTEVNLKSDYVLYQETYIPGGVPQNYGGLDPLGLRQTNNQDAFYNLVLGANYDETFRERHRVDAGFQVFKSLYHEGLVETAGFGTLETPSGRIINPYSYQGKIKSVLLGARLHLAYTYDISESVSFGLNGMYSYATNTVQSSDLTVSPDFFSLLNGNSMSLFASAAGPLSSLPSSKDIRSQLGIHFLFRY